MPMILLLALTNVPMIFMVACWAQALDLIWIESDISRTIYRFCYFFMIMFLYNFVGAIILIALSYWEEANGTD